LSRQRKWPFLCRGRDFLHGFNVFLVLAVFAVRPWISPCRGLFQATGRVRFTFSTFSPISTFLSVLAVFAVRPWFSPCRGLFPATGRVRFTFSPTSTFLSVLAVLAVFAVRPWFSPCRGLFQATDRVRFTFSPFSPTSTFLSVFSVLAVFAVRPWFSPCRGLFPATGRVWFTFSPTSTFLSVLAVYAVRTWFSPCRGLFQGTERVRRVRFTLHDVSPDFNVFVRFGRFRCSAVVYTVSGLRYTTYLPTLPDITVFPRLSEYSHLFRKSWTIPCLLRVVVVIV